MISRSLTAAASGAAAGLGLWATLGSIDRIQAPSGAVRVAMLPAAGTLLGCVAVGAVVFVLLDALARSRGTRDPAPPRGFDWPHASLVVLAAAGLLVLPYLPWVPDLAPGLMLLAGPGALLAWGILGALAVWAAALERRLTTVPSPPASAGEARARRRRWTTAILLASLASSAVLAERFTRTPLFPGGDEPHYLVIAQSLWRDGDLLIENNHKRGDYQEYFHRTLTPHYLTRGVDRQIYSIHPIGMPVLMTPFYAMGGYDLVVWAFLLLGAIAMTAAWRLAWAVTGSASAATFGWAVLALGPPWIFNTFAVYPEIPAACAVALAFAWTSGWRAEAGPDANLPALPAWRWWAAGAAIGTLPWFSTKYVVMGAVLGLLTLLRAWLPWPREAAERTRAFWRTVAIVVPNVVLLSGWFLFFKLIWGTWSPSAPYGSQRETKLAYLPSGGPGLLFDQEYGIVAFAPALLTVIPGLWVLWRAGGARRRLAVEVVAVFAGLLAVVGAFHIWWGGSAIVGRPLVSALPLLLLPVAAQWQACEGENVRRALQRVLLCVGGALTVLLAVAQSGLLLVAGRDGSSQVLEYLAPSTPVWTLLPTFLRQSPAQAWTLVALWGGLALLRGVVFSGRRFQPERPGRDHLLAVWQVVIMVGVASAFATLHGAASTPPPSLEERARVRLLDEYDASRRPLAIRYDPLTRIDPAVVPELFPIVVHAAGDRREDRATQLFGRRLSLPAGTYGVDLVFPPGVVPDGSAQGAQPAGAPSSVDGALAVHAGRVSPPLETWTVSVVPPGVWARTFSLPVDIGFVGFKASAPITAASPRLRLTPQRIVDASARPQTPAVLGSATQAGLAVLVHGEDAWPEPAGIWLRGKSTVMLTLVFPDDAVRTFDLRAGARQVTVTAQWGATTTSWDLPPGQVVRTFIDAPPARPGQQGRSSQLRITTSDGFVPAEVDPASRDRRLLGAWLELGRVVPGSLGSLLGGLRHDRPPAPPATRR
ncbi:hypothetical protein TBR22_A35770 [Luteitalea sp. TBR-22]|uniref:hypothetical protein n=1 Tax=Luteitalea sp. TBR-22 TaxID=2802971 RepID=UPI001AF842E8|nr:hypothetical protein [Luteitalea sp. TBR-22]BCS34347.1 hypothetical protein TBR22_A35770 [Luteitalea sp. TBR-22]